MARASNVDYELVIYDELPPPSARGQGRSILNAQLDTIKENKEAWERPVRIGLYSVGTAATAAKNVLQQRFGRNPAVQGWKFYTRPIPKDTSGESDTLRGLFAVYTPESIVDGAWEAHQKAEEKRIADLKAARAAQAEEDEYDDEDDDEVEDEAAEVTG